MRAMLVSFASYNLWLDWRKTAPFLAKQFTDYEPGIHYSQFQMQSGVTGINTVRIYNPIKQSYQQDPNGVFIRKWIPELKDIPTSFIHEPWRWPTSTSNYEAPIVNHELTIKSARAQISLRWKMSGFEKKASKINQKLGSRARPKKKQKKIKQNDSKQMGFDF